MSAGLSFLKTMSVPPQDLMAAYRARKDNARTSVKSKYHIMGFISSGTYGRVYKAHAGGKFYAIKKFKPEKEGEILTYTGISQSAIREIALNREIRHENIVALREVILEDKSIYMVFEYADHDFLQLIHQHSTPTRRPISHPILKSLIHQLLNGVLYLHACHILHRDLKPANILITASGVVKIGDLGLARLVHQPLQPLVMGDKVVVTIWYRAPELLLGAKHYNAAIDCWAVGCVFAEMMGLKPIFKGEEAKIDPKKTMPFQKEQLTKIFEVLGAPTVHDWPNLVTMPDYSQYNELGFQNRYKNMALGAWWKQHKIDSEKGYDLLRGLFQYDPDKRLTAHDALGHEWFQEVPLPTKNVFATCKEPYKTRTLTEDASSLLGSSTVQQSRPPTNPQPQQYRVAVPQNPVPGASNIQPRKRQRLE